MVQTEMNGNAIDYALKAIFEAMNPANNGKVAYIKRGELAFEDGEKLFNVSVLRED